MIDRFLRRDYFIRLTLFLESSGVWCSSVACHFLVYWVLFWKNLLVAIPKILCYPFPSQQLPSQFIPTAARVGPTIHF